MDFDWSITTARNQLLAVEQIDVKQMDVMIPGVICSETY